MKENVDTKNNKPNETCSEVEDDDVSSADEMEPKLKYKRLCNDVKSVLQKDSVSCVAFHSKIICIGTRWGIVYMLDHEGNISKNELLKSHTVAVNQISMDLKGEFIATCSDDGKAYAYGLYTSEHQFEMNLGRSVKSVAIDPHYYRLGGNRRFVTGDENLVLHEKTPFISRVKSVLLDENPGRVRNIKWQERFLAWANDVEVRVYDMVRHTSLARIKWHRNDGITPENFPCYLTWKNNTTLLIGWVDTVRICRIEKHKSVIRDTPEFIVNPLSTFQLDYIISGVCPFNVTQLVTLVHEKEKDENGKSLRPIMSFMAPEKSEYIEVDRDKLTLRGFENYSYSDYNLEFLSDENRFIITSPKDVVIAYTPDCDDRIEWMVKHGKFEEAMELVIKNDRYLQNNNLLTVGRKYINHLLKKNEFDKAGQLCAKILGTNTEHWEQEVFKFARLQRLRSISQYLPTSSSCRLNPHIYEMVLYEYLKMEPENFLKILKEWSPSLYNVPAVINAVTEPLVRDTEHKLILLESLAILYTHSGQYEKALNVYLKLKHKDVFKLISTYNLYPNININLNIENLMDLDTTKTIALLRDNKHISPDVIISHLQHNPYYLYLYLDALDTKDHKLITRKYHTQMIKLYAKFASSKLLPLLRRSDSYSIQDALAICKEMSLYPEMVYLLGRIGNTKEALRLLMNKIGDMEQAIFFCKEYDDKDLWEELVECSLSNPQYVTYLLQKISSFVDPRILVRRIGEHAPIPGLKNSLVKMLRDYNLQVSIKEGCKNIVVSDCFDLHKRLVTMQQRGLVVDDDLLCSICSQKVLVKNEGKANVLIFYCRHSFHEGCLPTNSSLKCIICCSQKNGPASA